MGARSWLIQAALMPRVRWGVPNPQVGSPSATCAQGVPSTEAIAQAQGVPSTEAIAQAPRVRWGYAQPPGRSLSAACSHVVFLLL
jgi:hypothetical protein